MAPTITHRQAVRLLAGLVPAAALAFAPTADAKLVRGTVVHRNLRAHSFVLAGATGTLTPIHATHSPALGRTVVASVRRLANGTYALRHLRSVGARRRIRALGVVTHVDPRSASFTLSAEGVSMLVRRGARRARVASASPLPAVGTKVAVTGELREGGALDAETVKDDGTDHGAIDVEGTITAIDSEARTLSVSAEDNNLSGESVTVSVPSTFDMTKFAVGQEVQLQVTLMPDGTYLLQGSSSDEGARGAEDKTDQQGEETDAADKEDAASGDREGSSGDHEGSSSGDHTEGSSDGTGSSSPASTEAAS
jgi:hypothetical protein